MAITPEKDEDDKIVLQHIVVKMEKTLAEISALRWWNCWRAPVMAAKCLGTFNYVTHEIYTC